MKKLTAILLALTLLLTCLPALAASTHYEEMGLTFDFSPVMSQSCNYLDLVENGVLIVTPMSP